MPAGITNITDKRQGMWSPPIGVLNQPWFDAAFASRFFPDNRIFKSAYNCDILGECTMGTWLEEYMGYGTSCDTKYSLIETFDTYEQIKVKTDTTIPANPATGVIALDLQSHFVGGIYILPQLGNTIVGGDGTLMDVTAVNTTTPNAATITVKIRDVIATAKTIVAGSELMVLSGRRSEDCKCPEGQFSFRDIPAIHDLEMEGWDDRGEICGEALIGCQFLRIPFTDEEGNEYKYWYTPALQDMYRRFEKRKYYERLFNPNFGLFPKLKLQAMNFGTAAIDAITLDDVTAWKRSLTENGVTCNEYAVFASPAQFGYWQNFMNSQGVDRLQYTLNDRMDCNWINMQYCGIKISGLTLHIYEDCTWGNKRNMGGIGSAFGNTSMFIPLCNRTKNVGGANDNKMLTTVYWQDKTGKVWDIVTDTNGVLTPERNTFGAGCIQQEWTLQTRFTQEVHCANSWGVSNLP